MVQWVPLVPHRFRVPALILSWSYFQCGVLQVLPMLQFSAKLPLNVNECVHGVQSHPHSLAMHPYTNHHHHHHLWLPNLMKQSSAILYKLTNVRYNFFFITSTYKYQYTLSIDTVFYTCTANHSAFWLFLTFFWRIFGFPNILRRCKIYLH